MAIFKTYCLALFLPVLISSQDFADEDDAEGEESLMSVDMQRACPMVKLDAPGKTIKRTPAIWGQYTLQFDTFNSKPLYKMHSQLCGRKRIVDGKMLPHKVDCHGGGPFFIYYATQQNMWHLASAVGSDTPVLMVPAETISPDKVTADWQYKKKFFSGPKFVPDASINATCNTKESNHGRTMNLKNITTNRAGGCLGWRKTGGCDPDGTREKEQDKDCKATIDSKLSGFCQCANGVRQKFACGHDVITCASVCAVKYPVVLAQSGERVWTNQIASNLLKSSGDWLSSQTANQWVLFDFGKVQAIAVVTFSLWGSSGSPHSVELQTSKTHLGPWKTAEKFNIPQNAKSFKKQVHRSSRFWRLFINSNWGAVWGVGLKEVKFLPPKASGHHMFGASDPCSLFTTQASCVYDSSTGGGTNSLAVARVAENRVYCGWCGADKQKQKCTSGNPHKPTSVECAGSWLWNTDSVFKHTIATMPGSASACAEQTNCSTCSLQLECGWCISSQSCRSSNCKAWSTRHCSNFDSVRKVTVQRK
jgi:hypothetical protein